MKNKSFSKINSITTGNATDSITEGCVVIEGGAFRGIYAAAVLDVLMEAGINLSCAIGVSAGALNGMNYISGQIGRAALITLNHRFDKQYVGLSTLIKTKNIIGYDYAFGELMDIYPFNHERFNNESQRFVVVATNLKSGAPCYFEKGKCSDIKKALKASSSLPYISKPTAIDGTPHLDGGCSDKIPFEWAISNGYSKVVVIKTQHTTYRKPKTTPSSKMLAGRFYRKYPIFAEKLCENNEMYNEQLERLEVAEESGKVFVISPSVPVAVSRFENDLEKLGQLYLLGRKDATELIPKIKNYLEK